MLALAFVIGIVAGLRAVLAPAAISWAAASGLLPLGGTWLSFMGWQYTPWFWTVAAGAEIVTDQLPSTPSRKVPAQFGARIVMGGLSGACIGEVTGNVFFGAVLGVVGAVVGTFAGSGLRDRLAVAFGSDRPAAILEDVIAIVAAVAVAAALW